jgi:hypothetical protein
MGGSGGNFDKELFIRDGKIVPSGPLDPSLNTMEEVYAWVVQVRDDGSAAAHVSEQNLTGLTASATRWTTDGSEKVSQHGNFNAGPAVGLAIGIARTPDGKLNLSWWSEMVNLQIVGLKGSASGT